MEIVWSPQSLKDLEQIGDYIAEDSPEKAVTFINKLINSVEQLINFPLSGHIVEENPMFRQVICQGYRLIYYAEQDTISIITVLSPYRVIENL